MLSKHFSLELFFMVECQTSKSKHFYSCVCVPIYVSMPSVYRCLIKKTRTEGLILKPCTAAGGTGTAIVSHLTWVLRTDVDLEAQQKALPATEPHLCRPL